MAGCSSPAGSALPPNTFPSCSDACGVVGGEPRYFAQSHRKEKELARFMGNSAVEICSSSEICSSPSLIFAKTLPPRSDTSLDGRSGCFPSGRGAKCVPLCTELARELGREPDDGELGVSQNHSDDRERLIACGDPCAPPAGLLSAVNTLPLCSELPRDDGGDLETQSQTELSFLDNPAGAGGGGLGASSGPSGLLC